MATKDDGQRGEVGVVATLAQREDGSLRLVLDDVDSLQGTSPMQWSTRGLYTLKDFDRKKLLDGQLSRDELAMVGENLLVRLAALGGLTK